MSFAGQIRQELIRQITSARHCRVAEMAALLSFCGTIQLTEEDQLSLEVETEQETVCSTFLQLVKKTFRFPEEQIQYEQQLRAKTSRYRILIEEPAAVTAILQAVGVLDKTGAFGEDVPLEEQSWLQKTCCKRAYLRGAFLAAGVVSDPNRSYHMEFVCASREAAEQLAGLLASLGVTAMVSGRGKHFLAYIKEGAQISDVLGMLGARVSMMAFENARIVREVRGNVNRKVNCETANIRKTADAAAEQIQDIRYIRETAGPGSLSPILDETASLRVQYPTATLQELGNMLDPPVGKSGMNHRLRKISAIAARLRAEQGGERKSW